MLLPTSITIENVAALAEEFRGWMANDASTLMLDASGVATITTPGVQLLLSLSKSAADAGSVLVLEQPSQPLSEAFRLLGLENMLKSSGRIKEAAHG